MKIHVHAGVHKTASTYLQNVMQQNLPALTRAGIGYAPLAAIRKALTARLHELCPETFRIEDIQPLFFDGAPPPQKVRGLLLSDENLLGLTSAFLNSGQLYENGGENLVRLRRLIPDHDLTLFVSIRSYDEFIASIYCEGLRWSRTSVPFAEFRARLDLETLRWPSVLARMNEALRPAKIVVWRYEDFNGLEQEIASKMAFDFPEALDIELASRLKCSMSHAAVERTDALIRLIGRRATAHLVPLIDARYSKGRGYAPFSPWSADERSALRDLYDADVRALPGDWLFTPQAEPAR